MRLRRNVNNAFVFAAQAAKTNNIFSGKNETSMTYFNLSSFIREHVINRQDSFFEADLQQYGLQLREQLQEARMLVIGGAGTIGSSFIRAALRHGQPASLYVVDINENGLTELTRDLRSTAGMVVPADYKTYPISFSEPVFARLLQREGPFDIVANFAAHKHVRSEKDRYSIEAMLENNVLRARDLLALLAGQPPKHFFCVSTDKAANPVNVMGASKKLMEELIMAYADKIKITTARFANVAFSNGSLPAGFLERLARHQPLSAPRDIQRFFVSPDESGEICLMACLLGESGQIFYPRLQTELHTNTFTHIADKLLEAKGLSPYHCQSEEEARQLAALWAAQGRVMQDKPLPYPVYYFSSDTSGEKPYEEFYTESDQRDEQRFNSLGVITNAPRPSLQAIDRVVDELRAMFEQPALSKAQLVAALQQVIPGFAHHETGKGLDEKM